jgi:hypothetical protein
MDRRTAIVEEFQQRRSADRAPPRLRFQDANAATFASERDCRCKTIWTGADNDGVNHKAWLGDSNGLSEKFDIQKTPHSIRRSPDVLIVEG